MCVYIYIYVKSQMNHHRSTTVTTIQLFKHNMLTLLTISILLIMCITLILNRIHIMI